jgi:hypothetical protein
MNQTCSRILKRDVKSQLTVLLSGKISLNHGDLLGDKIKEAKKVSLLDQNTNFFYFAFFPLSRKIMLKKIPLNEFRLCVFLQLEEVIDRVTARMRYLVHRGYPVPERIQGKWPSYVSHIYLC